MTIQGAIVTSLLIRYATGFITIRTPIFNTTSGRMAFTGPAGEAGYSPPGPGGTVVWTMPDGRTAAYYPGVGVDTGNANGLIAYAAQQALYGQVEGFLSLGQIQTPAQAAKIGYATLKARAGPSVSVTATLEPTGAGDNPYTDFLVGEWVSVPDEGGTPELVQVESMTVTEDEEGNPIFVPEVKTAQAHAELQIQRAIAQMINGSLAGSVATATDPSAPPLVGKHPDDKVIRFHMAGPLTAVVSDDSPAPRTGTVYKVTYNLTNPSTSGDVVFHIFKNDILLVDAGTGLPLTPTLHVGENHNFAFYMIPMQGSLSLTPDRLSIQPVSLGTGASGLVVDFHMT